MGSARANGALRIRSRRRMRAKIAFRPGIVQVSRAIMMLNQAVPARFSLLPVVASTCGSAL